MTQIEALRVSYAHYGHETAAFVMCELIDALESELKRKDARETGEAK